MVTDKIWDAVIVGAGPAGCSAALYAAQGGLSVLLLEKKSAGGQMNLTAEIDNWPGESAPADGMTLGERMQKHAIRAGAVFRYGTVTAMALTGETKTVSYTAGQGTEQGKQEEKLTARNVILATGAAPRRLGLPGEEDLVGSGLSFCAACDGRLYRNGIAAVVGGGNTAAYDVRSLSRLCRHVTLIHREKEFQMPAARLEELRRLDNVTVLHPYAVTAYRTAADPVLHLTALELTHMETGAVCTLDCDGVFLAAGTIPRTELVKNLLPLTDTGAVITDERCRTPLPGVYAIGDCRDTDHRQILTACADGCRAALQMQE